MKGLQCFYLDGFCLFVCLFVGLLAPEESFPTFQIKKEMQKTYEISWKFLRRRKRKRKKENNPREK